MADNRKLPGAVDTPGGCGAIQNDLDWLENLMKLNKGEFQVLHLGMVNSMSSYMLWSDQLESRLAQSNIRVRHKVCALMERLANSIMGCIRKSITSRLRVILHSALVRHLHRAGLVLGFLVYAKHELKTSQQRPQSR